MQSKIINSTHQSLVLLVTVSLQPWYKLHHRVKNSFLHSNHLSRDHGSARSIARSLATTAGVADPQPASSHRNDHYSKLILCYPGLSKRRSRRPACSALSLGLRFKERRRRARTWWLSLWLPAGLSHAASLLFPLQLDQASRSYSWNPRVHSRLMKRCRQYRNAG